MTENCMPNSKLASLNGLKFLIVISRSCMSLVYSDFPSDGGGDEGGAALLQKGNRPLRGRAQGVQLRHLRRNVGDDGALFIKWRLR